MIVLKFGGSSVADAEGIRRACSIVASRQDRAPAVVVSALGGVTDLLQEATAAAGRGDLAGQEAATAGIERRHRWALSGCLDDPEARHDAEMVLADIFDEMKQLLRSIRTLGELSPRADDAVLACGELWSSRLLASALSDAGLPAIWIDPRKVVATDGGHGSAVPDLDRMQRTVAEQVLPLVDAGKIPVIGGFVGASPEGITTTLGRGGGDTTAAMIGAAGGADEIQIWTDVDGLMSADPRLAPEASCLPEVSFGEASEMASFGARVLHPASVSPAVAASIPVRVLNSRRPERTGTVVRESSDPTHRGIVSLASRSGMTAVFLEADRAVSGSVFRQQTTARLSGSDALPELAQISAVGGLAVFREPVAANRLGVSWAELGQVRIVENTGVVAAVGDRLRDDHVLKGQVCLELAALAPVALGAGGTTLSVYALYPEEMLEQAVRQLHRRFFQEVSRT